MAEFSAVPVTHPVWRILAAKDFSSDKTRLCCLPLIRFVIRGLLPGVSLSRVVRREVDSTAGNKEQES